MRLFLVLSLLSLELPLLIDALLPENKLTFINHDHSTIKLRPSTWKHNYGKQFKFNIKMNQEDGTVITIINNNGQIFTLTINAGHFQADHQGNVLKTPIMNTWNQVELIQNNEDNLVRLHINGESTIGLDGQQWSITHWKEAWIGAYRDINSEKTNSSFIGCLKLLNHHRIPHINHLIERRGLVLDDCVDACTVQVCQNGGKCVNNYRNVTCDCMGTGFEGPTCEKEAVAYSLKTNEKIEMKRLPDIFTLSKTTNIETLHMRIRTNQPRGVLFHFTNLLKEAINMELLDGVLNVKVNTVRDEYSTSIGKDLHDNQWHFVTLTIKTDKIEVTMDEHFKNEIVVKPNKQDNEKSLDSDQKPSIVIGDRHFAGCLQQVYLNGFDIVESLQSKEKYFEADGGKKNCNK